MRISFIGGGARVRAVHKLFDKEGFETGGFFCNPLSECADIAIETNSMLYGCTDDLCNDSDIVVIATPDRVLPQVVNTLSKLHTNGKIIISVADKVHQSELDTGYENTYGVICGGVPFEHLNSAELEKASIVCEIKGKRSDDFKKAIEVSGIKCSFVTKEQLELYRTAFHMVHSGISAVLTAGEKFLKIAADKDASDLFPVIRNAGISIINKNGIKADNMYKSGKLADIMNHINTLENIGIDSVTDMHKAIAAYLTEVNCTDKECADDVIRRIKR